MFLSKKSATFSEHAHEKPLAVLHMALGLCLTQRERPMFDIHREELNWAGHKLVLETGRIARQADGAVLATYGETTVLATVVSAKAPREGVDFLPLTVDYQEKFY